MVLIFTVLPFYSSILWPLLHCRWKDKDVTPSVTCRRKTRPSHHQSPAGGERQGRHTISHLQEEIDKDVTPSVTCRRKTRTSHHQSPAGGERQGRHTISHRQEDRRRKTKHSTIILERTRSFQDHRQSDQKCLQDGVEHAWAFLVHRYHLELNINLHFSQSASQSFSISVSISLLQYFSWTQHPNQYFCHSQHLTQSAFQLQPASHSVFLSQSASHSVFQSQSASHPVSISVTVSISVNISVTVSTSLSISVTTSHPISFSVTASHSVFQSQSASHPVSISVTVSISLSISVTVSISLSISVTVSISLSISVTVRISLSQYFSHSKHLPPSVFQSRLLKTQSVYIYPLDPQVHHLDFHSVTITYTLESTELERNKTPFYSLTSWSWQIPNLHWTQQFNVKVTPTPKTCLWSLCRNMQQSASLLLLLFLRLWSDGSHSICWRSHRATKTPLILFGGNFFSHFPRADTLHSRQRPVTVSWHKLSSQSVSASAISQRLCTTKLVM